MMEVLERKSCKMDDVRWMMYDGKWTEAEVFTLLSLNSLQRLMISTNFEAQI